MQCSKRHPSRLAVFGDQGRQQDASVVVKRGGGLIQQPHWTRRDEQPRKREAARLTLAQDTGRQILGARKADALQNIKPSATEQARPIAHVRACARGALSPFWCPRKWTAKGKFFGALKANGS